MKVKFLPHNEEHEIKPDQTVLQLAQEKGIRIKSVCRGMPSCAECRVRLIEGDHNVLPPSEKELSLIGTGYFIDGRRLSCQLLCFGDITVDLEEQVEKAKVDQHKRPQGNLRKERAEVSHAVSGNLIEQDEEMAQMIEGDEEPAFEEKPKSEPREKGRRASSSNGEGPKSNQNKKKSSSRSGSRRGRRRGR